MVRLTTGRIDIIAPNTTTNAWTISTGKKARAKKIMWANRSGGNGMLRLGYVNVVAGAFVQVLPDILMLNGFDGELGENELPLCGNMPEGFSADTSPLAGSTGVIVLQATVGGAGALSVQVVLEIEEE